MFKTKLTVEIEVETQFGPTDAVSIIQNKLNFPAVRGLRLIDLSTDYIPLTELDHNRKYIDQTLFPVNLK